MDNTKQRQEAIEEAKRIVSLKPVYFDTETTGTHNTAEIVEISFVDHNGIVILDTLIKPQSLIPEGATNVHHISNEMVASAPTWADAWPKIKGIISNQRLAIYNADFDLRLIKQTHLQAGLVWEPVGAKASCVMLLYAKFYGEWNEYRGNYKWQSLEKAGRQCQLEIPNSHRAKDDTLLTRAVLHFMAGAK